MSQFPGAETPGQQEQDDEHLSEQGVALDATGTTEVGTLLTDRARVMRVAHESDDAADAEFNINVNGDPVFEAAQSLDAVGDFERFVPDQNTNVSDGPVTVEVEITAASATAGATGSFVVQLEDRA